MPEKPVRYTPIISFTLAGIVIGYLLVHPFAMLAYILGPQHPHDFMDVALWHRQLSLAFSPEMLAMGAAFAFMGGVAGFGLGAWYLQKERLAVEKLESQRRQVALATMRELMVTLAHYIRNANLVIGGFSSRLARGNSDREVLHDLALIHRASQEIDAVITALESLTQIEHTQYIDAWQTRMIDLHQQFKARLQESAAPATGKENHAARKKA
jgi:signal transduction histidine kinase